VGRSRRQQDRQADGRQADDGGNRHPQPGPARSCRNPSAGHRVSRCAWLPVCRPARRQAGSNRAERQLDRSAAGRFQFRHLKQDRVLELAQLPAGLDAQLAGQQFAGTAEGGQRLGLPP
jgi:hypothetical protein